MSLDVEITQPILNEVLVWKDGVIKPANEEEKRIVFPYGQDESLMWRGNITHNLTEMAKHIPCDIGVVNEDTPTLYDVVWKGGGSKASDVKLRLQSALIYMHNNRQELAEKYNTPNGRFETLKLFVKDFHWACTRITDGIVRVDP